MSVVIVEVAPPDPPAPLVAALLTACGATLRDTRCELASEPEPVDTVAIAIVRWQARDELGVRVEVAARAPETAPRWQTRLLTFRDADARVERWRAVGLTISTLVGDVRGPGRAAEDPGVERASKTAGEPPAPQNAPVEAPPPAVEPAQTSQVVDSRASSPAQERFWLGAAAAVGPALGSHARIGGVLEGGWRPSGSGLLRASFGATTQLGDEDDVGVDWLHASLTAGLSLPLGAITLEPRAGARVERVHAASPERAGVAPGSAARVQAGLLVGGEVVVGRPSAVQWVLGAEAWRNASPTEVRAGARAVALDPALGGLVTIGIRFGFLAH